MSKSKLKKFINVIGSENLVEAMIRSKVISKEIEKYLKIRRLEIELKKLNLVRTY